MHVLLIPLGSHGDVHPFAGLALALRARGHDVTFMTSAAFEPIAKRLDVEFVGLGNADEFHQALAHPDLWNPRKAFGRVAQLMLRFLRPVYEEVAARQRPGQTIIAAPFSAFGARIARETLGVPLATIHLQPFLLRSEHLPPVVAGPPPHLFETPRGARLVYWIADHFILDPAIAREINRFRREHGLPRERRLMRRWIHSPDPVLGLFPDWFGPPQPDWPPRARTTAFPLFDEARSREEPLDPDLSAFLDDGPPPIVFTAGTAMTHGRAFFAESTEACRRSNWRGLLLARHPDQIPQALPPGVRHVAYAPFSRLLPRCRAIVHHGGIGTSAQALAAALPQLISPLAHDQHDNAARLERLGVGRTLLPNAYKGQAIETALNSLFSQANLHTALQCWSDKIEQIPDPLASACDALEALADRAAPVVPR